MHQNSKTSSVSKKSAWPRASGIDIGHLYRRGGRSSECRTSSAPAVEQSLSRSQPTRPRLMSIVRPQRLATGVLLASTRAAVRPAVISRSQPAAGSSSCRVRLPPPRSRLNVRSYATLPESSSGRPGGVRISYLFGGLVGLGFLVTTYGLYVAVHGRS